MKFALAILFAISAAAHGNSGHSDKSATNNRATEASTPHCDSDGCGTHMVGHGTVSRGHSNSFDSDADKGVSKHLPKADASKSSGGSRAVQEK